MDKPDLLTAIDNAGANKPTGAIATEAHLDKIRRWMAQQQECCPTTVRDFVYEGVTIRRAMVALPAGQEYAVWGAN